MCQNETALRGVEESSELLSDVSTGVANSTHEAVATTGVEPGGVPAEAVDLLSGMSGVQVIAILAVIGLFVIVAAWFADDVRNRIEDELYWRRNHRRRGWWQREFEKIKRFFRARRVIPVFGLVSGSQTDPSHSSAPNFEDVTSEAVGQSDVLSPELQPQTEVLVDERGSVSDSEHPLRIELADAKEQLSLLRRQAEDDQAFGREQVETLEENLANQATQIEKLQASFGEATSNADQLTSALEESNVRCSQLTEEAAAVERVGEISQSDLAAASQEIEALRLDLNRAGNELQAASQQASDQANLADRLREEHTLLESALEAIENQCAEKDVRVNELSKARQELDARLQEEIDQHAIEANQFKSAIAEHESRLIVSQEEVASLRSEFAKHAADAKQKLDEALATLAEEQSLHNQLKETAVEDWEELSSQASRLREQESEIDSLNSLTEQLSEQKDKSGQELAAALTMLEKQKALLAKFKEDSQKREQDERAAHLSQVKTLEENLANRATQIEKLEASLAEAASNADRMAASLEEANVRGQDQTEQLAALQRMEDESRSNFADATKEIETLRLKVGRTETKLETAAGEVLEKANLAARLRQECMTVTSALENAENRLAEKHAGSSELAKERDELQAKLEEEIDTRASATRGLEGKIAERETQLVAFREEVAKLRSEIAHQAEDAQVKLDETLSMLSDQQKIHDQLKEAATGDVDQLSRQSSKLRELEGDLDSFRQQAAESEQKLAANIVLLEQERAFNVEAADAAREHKEEIGALVAKNSELETHLASIQQQSELTERESAETRERLTNEQELRTKTLEELEARENRINELEKAAEALSVKEASDNELVKKLAGYRKAYRKSKILIEGLVVQKSEMSDLATEYLAMARTIRQELDEERETNVRLKSELENASRSEVSFSDPKVKREVDRLAGSYVLDLKSQFEQKIKRKNELIQELLNRPDVEKSRR